MGLKMPLTEFKSARQPYAQEQMSLGFLQSHVTSHHPSVTAPSAVSRGTFAQPRAGRGLSAVCHLGLRLEVSRGRHASTHPHPAPDRHMAWRRAHSSLRRSLAVSRGVRVGAQSGRSGSVQLALNHIKGNLRGQGLPGNGRSMCPLSSVCPTPLLPGPTARAPDRCRSASKKALCLSGSHSHWEMNLHSSEGARLPVPSLVGPSGHLRRNSTNS